MASPEARMSEATKADDRGTVGVGLAARVAGPLLFALRLWGSVSLALYAAFALQLSEPSWAGTTAALVCQPQLGASLRKGSFRLVGTAVGGIAIVVIAAVFPQNRVGFLISLALWSALCGFLGALLKNFAAYGAGLAGFTAAVIAADVFGPTGGASDAVATYAIFRVVEITVGIVSAGVVLALTDLGGARRRLAGQFAQAAVGVLSGLAGSFARAGPDDRASSDMRREAMRRVIALDPLIDTALGEASDLRYRSGILQAAVTGLVTTVSAWRTLALGLRGLSVAERAAEAQPIGVAFARLASTTGDLPLNPASLRDACSRAAQTMARLTADSPSAQLLADASAEALIGMTRAFNGLTLLSDPNRARRADSLARLNVPDWLPPTVVAVRVFVAAGLVSLFWIVTAWPGGPLALTFAIVMTVIFPLQGAQAYSAAMAFLAGSVLSATLAAALLFGVLPTVATFPGLCVALGLAFVPLGILIAWPWRPVFFTAAAINLIPLLSLKNVMSYDAAAFANTVLAVLCGIAVGTILIRILPPPSPALRTRRLLRFALTDVRTFARGHKTLSQSAWAERMFARIVALPDETAPAERAYMASALAVGARIIRLRKVAPRFASDATIARALSPIADGRLEAAREGLAALDHELTAHAANVKIVRRLRATVLAVSEELEALPEFFDQ